MDSSLHVHYVQHSLYVHVLWMVEQTWIWPQQKNTVCYDSQANTSHSWNHHTYSYMYRLTYGF